MGTLLHSCVEVHDLIKLSFGVVSWVGEGMGVLDGSTYPKGKGRFQLTLVSVVYLFNRNVFGSCVKVGKISVWTIHCWNLRFIGFLKIQSIPG